jgi:acyl carrier protein
MGIPLKEIEKCLMSLLCNKLKALPEDIDKNLLFQDMGLTSLDAVIISSELEEALDIPIDPTIFFEHSTYSKLLIKLDLLCT